MSITRDVLRYLINTKFSDIPEQAVLRTKELILDDIGNAFGGSVLNSGKIITKWGKLQRDLPESTIIADGTKVPTWAAAGVNAQLSFALDFMETYRNIGHPGSGAVMSALALGERERADGKEFITTVCATYDLAGRIIDATFPTSDHKARIWNESWHICGPLMTAIRLLKLGEEQGMNALGMGLGNAPTLNVHNVLYIPGSMSKAGNHLHAFIGINAAILAKLGYTGYHEILDDPYPYWTTISDKNDPKAYTNELGQTFFTVTAMALKPWPTCRWAQPGIESLVTIMKDQDLIASQIHSIIYHAHEKITNFPYDNIRPQTPEDAYWSVPWAFANAVLGYKAGPDWYIEERFNDKPLMEIMEKVKIETLQEAVKAFYDEPEKSVTLIDVKTVNGKVYSKRTEYCKGDPQQPMTHAEIIDKFSSQADGIIGKDKAEKIVDIIEKLEDLDDISKLSRLLF